MQTPTCGCEDEDAGRAKASIRAAIGYAELIDESHFRAVIRRCPVCGGQFLTMFGERVDWADGDDPQTWIGVQISETEAAAIMSGWSSGPIDEALLARVLVGERRMVYHDMPKGTPEVLERRTGLLMIPAHD